MVFVQFICFSKLLSYSLSRSFIHLFKAPLNLLLTHSFMETICRSTRWKSALHLVKPFETFYKLNQVKSRSHNYKSVLIKMAMNSVICGCSSGVIFLPVYQHTHTFNTADNSVLS